MNKQIEEKRELKKIEIQKEEIKERPKKEENKFSNFFKDKTNWILIAILLFSFILRLTYFNVNEAVWWDSADYLMGAKEIGTNIDLETYELNPRRPFFLSVFWGALLALGANEAVLHFTVLIFSMIAVWLTYLIGRELYNKRVGLIAALFMAPFWSLIFHTARLLTDVIALAFWMIAAYFFWNGYVKKKSNMYSIYSGIAMGLAVLTRAASLINFIPLIAIVLAKEGKRFYKNKTIWKALIIFILILSPFIIWLFTTYDNPVQKFTGIGGGESRFIGRGQFLRLWTNLETISNMVLTPIILEKLSAIFITPNIAGLLLFLVFFYLVSNLFIGFDLLVKEKNEKLMKKLFLLVWFLTPYLFYSLTGPGVEDRYLLAMFPPMFIVFGTGLMRLKNRIDKITKYVGPTIILLFFIILIPAQVNFSDDIIKARSTSYAPVAYGGIWIKENSNPEDKVISASKFQNMYYSERETYPFCEDNTCMNDENIFIKRLEEINPRFVVISIFEPGFTPKYAYDIATRYPDLLKPVNGYFLDEQQTQPSLIIYEYAGEDQSS